MEEMIRTKKKALKQQLKLARQDVNAREALVKAKTEEIERLTELAEQRQVPPSFPLLPSLQSGLSMYIGCMKRKSGNRNMS